MLAVAVLGEAPTATGLAGKTGEMSRRVPLIASILFVLLFGTALSDGAAAMQLVALHQRAIVAR
jgi:hypothetical protein